MVDIVNVSAMSKKLFKKKIEKKIKDFKINSTRKGNGMTIHLTNINVTLRPNSYEFCFLLSETCTYTGVKF